MSSSTDLSLPFIGQQMTIYGGLIIIITGVLGNLINIIIFLSLKTFRQSSCAFYLIIMSFVNIGQLLFGLLSRVMITGYGIDWTASSLFFCKFRTTFFVLCALISYSCLCLATIDQYFATCTRPRWQQWSNIKLAQRLVLISIFISCLIIIPYPMYFNHITTLTGKIICTTTDVLMSQYRGYFVPLCLSGYIPDIITVVFGILAYRNIQDIAYRTVPLVRRELDKQLTTMVLVQVVINFFTNVPCVTTNAVMFGTNGIKNTNILEKIQFAFTVTTIIFYSYFASSFYMYICVSERFRRQLFHVFCVIHWQQQRILINQVLPIQQKSG